MKINIVVGGRWHAFNLAEQLHCRGIEKSCQGPTNTEEGSLFPMLPSIVDTDFVEAVHL